MGHYSNIEFKCPYFTGDEKLEVRCEGGCRQRFKDREEAREYIKKHCASTKGWKQCSLANSRTGYYERTDK